MAAEFQHVHEGEISPEQHNDWTERSDLSGVRGLMLDVRSVCVVPASLNVPKWADKRLGPPHLYICTTARGGRDQDFFHLFLWAVWCVLKNLHTEQNTSNKKPMFSTEPYWRLKNCILKKKKKHKAMGEIPFCWKFLCVLGLIWL